MACVVSLAQGKLPTDPMGSENETIDICELSIVNHGSFVQLRIVSCRAATGTKKSMVFPLAPAHIRVSPFFLIAGMYFFDYEKQA
jgi:hypothetical protein